jgi:hypothetical protein
LRILIIGGYGVFGGRIVELLEVEARLTLIVTGRSLAKASAFCESRDQAQAELIPAAIDRAGDLAASFVHWAPDLVIDASGPFQDYGKTRYAVIEACLDRPCDYLDLADGSNFVAGVASFDARARQVGRFILSGVSSFPVLTAAVVRRLSAGMATVDSITGGIAPSPFAVVGQNVIRAIASYAGQPIALKRDGQMGQGHALTELVRFTVSPPGRRPLNNTLFSLVDVPDLRVLPGLWPQAATVWMGAGPVPEVLHRALIACAWLVRLRLLLSLSFLAPLMFTAINRLRWGEHRGGMFVVVRGKDTKGALTEQSWHLLAEGSDGPFIPSMAIEAIVHKTLAGQRPPPGARAATGDLELEDYEALFATRTIYSGVRGDPGAQAGRPLYGRILGDAWDSLPTQVRALHDIRTEATATGHATVTRGTGLLSRLAAAIIGFPRAGDDIPLTVHFTVRDGEETWTRTFAGHSFSSRQFAGVGRDEHLVCERFGALTFAMALVVEGDRLRLVVRGGRLFGVPLAPWLMPRSDAYESVEDGLFHFHVEISHPLTGLIVRYDGRLAR